MLNLGARPVTMFMIVMVAIVARVIIAGSRVVTVSVYWCISRMFTIVLVEMDILRYSRVAIVLLREGEVLHRGRWRRTVALPVGRSRRRVDSGNAVGPGHLVRQGYGARPPQGLSQRG